MFVRHYILKTDFSKKARLNECTEILFQYIVNINDICLLCECGASDSVANFSVFLNLLNQECFLFGTLPEMLNLIWTGYFQLTVASIYISIMNINKKQNT